LTSPITLATINGSVGNLKICRLNGKTFAIALTGQSTASGDLYNSELADKPLSSGKVYTSLFVRQWDSYVQENKSTIWYGALSNQEGKYVLSGLSNLLMTEKGYNPLKLESPVPPFGGSDNFDISKAGLVFISKDPKIDRANHTKTDLYYVPLKSFTESKAPLPQIIKTGNLRGYCGTPLFSPDAKSVAFTRMKNDKYESDKPRLLLIPDILDPSNVQEYFESKDGDGLWDRCPSISCWSLDGKDLYLTAEEHGRAKLWKTTAFPNNSKTNNLPTALFTQGAISDVKPLGKGTDKLFVTTTSLIDNSTYGILDPSGKDKIISISSNSKNGKAFGLSQNQVDEFWYQGAGDYKVHAWVMKPSNFDKTKKYPLAYLIHGGPQGAWLESWSTRWNPAIFAEQGYVVVTPNPTGSTGYGMSFQNGIKNQWGGRPYEDLVKGFEFIDSNLPYVDTTRSVALGASYGGYMMNWIQGHPLGRKFKALVTHDGVFSTLNQYSSDELFFPYHDFGGTLWENRAGYEKWDPARFVDNWATPHLIIHNELDYRLPISEGLAPFNVLQTKNIPSKFLTFSDENHVSLPYEKSRVKILIPLVGFKARK
jgi:dipeptidyl aminopeptidase/acylaminoacyl peptidase